MRETGIGTSLFLIAIGAVLAFAVNLQTTGIDLNAVGAILIVVGLIGLLFSFVALGEMTGWRGNTNAHVATTPLPVAPTHDHTTIETTEVVYEETDAPRVSRVRRTRG